MTIPRSIALALMVIAGFAVISLIRGAGYLGTMLPGSLPLGNVVAALALLAPAGVAVALSSRGTWLRLAALASLLASAAWLPASVILAGNPALNFQGSRGLVWLALSLAVAVGVFCTLLWALVASLVGLRRDTGAA